MASLQSILDQIQLYLDDGDPHRISLIKSQFKLFYINNKYYCRNAPVKDFCPADIEKLLSILISLKIIPPGTESLPDDYAALTFKKFFQHICRKSEDPLILNVTRLIENQYFYFMWILIGSVSLSSSLVVAILFSIKTIFNSVMNLVLRIMQSSKAIPILGFITSNAHGIFEMIYRGSDGKKGEEKLRLEKLFLIGSMVFNSIAYGLWMTQFGILPVVGCFIMLASSMTLMKHIVFLVKMSRQYDVFELEHPLHDHANLAIQRANIRLETGLNLQKNILVTELFSAFFTLGAIGLSTFLSAGFVFTIACFAMVLIIEAARYGLELFLKNRAESRLHKKLTTLNDANGENLLSTSDGLVLKMISKNEGFLIKNNEGISGDIPSQSEALNDPILSEEHLPLRASVLSYSLFKLNHDGYQNVKQQVETFHL